MLVPVRLRQRHRPHWIPAFAGMTGLAWAGGRMRPGSRAWLDFSSARTRTAQQPAERRRKPPRSSFRRRPESARLAPPPASRPHHGRAGSRALRQRHRPHWIPAFAGMTGLGVGQGVGGGRMRQGSRGLAGFLSNRADPHCAAARRTPPQAAPLVIPAQAGIQKPARHRHPAGRPHHGRAGSSAPSATP